MLVPKKVVKSVLEKTLKRPVTIVRYAHLGSGWHGIGYEVIAKVAGKERHFVCKTLKPIHFGHDYPSDRVSNFVFQNQASRLVPRHIRSIAVGGYKPKTASLGNCHEFFQIIEKAQGTWYVDDLLRIKKEGKISDEDRSKAKLLSDYLVKLHKKKFRGKKERSESLYKRHTRDCVGHGEMLLGVLDTYPKVKWVSSKQITGLLLKAIAFRQRIPTSYNKRLCLIHGDFHPSNIIFQGRSLKVLDASREMYGEPADDVSSMALNYVWYSLQQTGRFKGVFKELFDIFWQNYFKKTRDKEMLNVIGLFFAFRAIVMAHPIYKQPDSVRQKMFRLATKVLEGRFKGI